MKNKKIALKLLSCQRLNIKFMDFIKMKKLIMRATLMILLFISLGSPQKSYATHAAGGEIFYSWLHDSTYFVIFKFYRDCSGIAAGTSQTLTISNTCGAASTTKTLNALPSGNYTFGSIVVNYQQGQPVFTPCPGYSTACSTPAGTAPNYGEYWYGDSIKLTSQCNHWIFGVSVGSRNTVSNYQNSSGQNLYLEATLDNLDAQGNSSPFFTIKPVPYVCINQPYSFNNGAVDINGDSLTFEMISALSAQSVPLTPLSPPVPPINLTTNPFQCNNTFNLNSSSGQMTFIPNLIGSYITTLLVKEYRNGILIGTCIRDVQISVNQCTSVQPTLDLDTPNIVGAIINNDRVEACATDSIHFNFHIKSTDTNAKLVVTDNHISAAVNSSLSFYNLAHDSVFASFSWKTSALDTGLHTLVIVVKDSNCANGGIPITQAFNIPIYVWPTTQAYHDTLICPGDSVHLKVVGGGGFTWTVLPGGSPITSLSCIHCTDPVATPLTTTSYVVTSSLTSICNHNVDTVTITVPALPVITVTPDTTTCVGNDLILNVNFAPSPGSFYATIWTPSTFLNDSTLSSPTCVHPTKDMVYTVHVIPNGLNKCSSNAAVNVTVLQGFKITNHDTTICKGASFSINTSGDNRYHFLWSPTTGVSNINTASPIITPDTSTLYTLTGSYPGCADTSNALFVTVEPLPLVSAGPDRQACFGDTIIMSGSLVYSTYNPSFNNYTYTWTPGADLDDAHALHPVFKATLTTTLILTASTPAGCTDSDKVVYTVNNSNFVSITNNDTAICPGNSVQLHMTGNYTGFAWSPNLWISDSTSTDPVVTPVTSTVYSVRAIDSHNCLDTASVLVTIHPNATISLPDSATIFPGDSYQMAPLGNCLYFSWFPPTGLTNALISNPVAMPAANAHYVVTASTEYGCSTKDSIDIFVADDSYIDVPNAYSPNSTTNNIIKVVHNGRAVLSYFRIYDRWGLKLFETTNINQGWDGTYNGQPQPMGTYIYMVEAVKPSGKIFYKQGNFILIR